jgi:Amt family ammonium transporter
VDLNALYARYENRGVDDPVGAVSVHFMNGLWGVISVGLFANGK